jgi:serine/threonine protein kinase
MSFKDSTPLLFAGRYQLQRPIGSGHTSTVWRAWDETLDRIVAVKVVSVALLPHVKLCARLLRETRTAAGLTHPGLPVIYDFGEASVQGGREVRVYVREGEVSDLGAVELSGAIAKQISDEMTFPGQIKVTVIRQIQAVAVAS